MQFQLPLKNDTLATSWLSYNDAIDASYAIYSVALWLLNIANAFTEGADTSQGKWWLLWVPNRHNQNSAWNTAYSIATASWTSALSMKVKTYIFNSIIKSLDTCSLKLAIFSSNTNNMCFDLDDTNKRISTSVFSGNATTVLGSGEEINKAYIVTSWWNKFLIHSWAATTNVYSYPLDASNNIIAGTVNTLSISPYYNPLWSVRVLWAKDNFVRCAVVGKNNLNQNISMNIILLSVSSSWVFTQVDSDNILSLSWTSWNWFTVWSYVKNNTIHAIVNTQGVQPKYITIDMTSTASNSITTIITWWGWDLTTVNHAATMIPVWYDWTKAVFVSNNGKVWTADWSWFTDTGVTGLSAKSIRYRNSTTKLATATNNLYSTWNTFYYNTNRFLCKDADIWTKVLFAYLMTWSNEEDDVTALGKCYATFALWNADWLSVKVNGVEYGNSIIGNLWELSTSIASLPTATSLLFEIAIANTLAKTLKTWFGITGWTYGSPTGTNDFGWSVSTWSTIWSNGSQLSITL